ncbi:MAG: hypothetical protein QM638_12170 [Nocardioides sp.]|uniref:DUF6414 family protein n=1 Tax=Nocardioides sp. TaxID=35761 RepID=UPI0039E48DCC
MADYELSHPVYLDVPMMLSFLAALEGGVAVVHDTTETSSETSARRAAATAGLRARLFTVASTDLKADGSLESTETTGSTSQVQRQHTAESLFNALIATLREDGQLRKVGDEDDLNSLAGGAIVEFEGTFRGNPLEDIIAFFAMLLPYVEAEKPNPKSGNPAQRAAAEKAVGGAALGQDVIRMFHLMASDIAASPVRDLLFRTPGGVPIVVTAATEFYGPATVEYLREGTFRVIGKVTRVLGPDGSINLARRTVLGLANPDVSSGMVEAARELDGVSLDIADALVSGPALQLLPLAIYI